METDQSEESIRREEDRIMDEMQAALCCSCEPQDVIARALSGLRSFYGAEWCGVVNQYRSHPAWQIAFWKGEKQHEINGTEDSALCFSCWMKVLQKEKGSGYLSAEMMEAHYPQEAQNNRERNLSNLIGVPFWWGYQGFVILRNAARVPDHSRLLAWMSCLIASEMHEIRRAGSGRLKIRKRERRLFPFVEPGAEKEREFRKHMDQMAIMIYLQRIRKLSSLDLEKRVWKNMEHLSF